MPSSGGVHRLLDTANVVSSTPILLTMMREAIRSSKTSILLRIKLLNIPGDFILLNGETIFRHSKEERILMLEEILHRHYFRLDTVQTEVLYVIKKQIY
jgi:hypothetical protein